MLLVWIFNDLLLLVTIIVVEEKYALGFLWKILWKLGATISPGFLTGVIYGYVQLHQIKINYNQLDSSVDASAPQ